MRPDTLNAAENGAATRPATEETKHDAQWHPTMTVEGKRRSWKLWLVAAAVLAFLGGVGVLGARTLPGGTTLAGQPLASGDEADDALDVADASLQRARFRIRTSIGTEVVLTGAELGLTVDRDKSARPVSHGVPSLQAWLKRLPSGPLESPLVVDARDDEALDAAAASVSAEPVNATLDVQPGGIDITPGSDGVQAEAPEVATGVARAIATIQTTAPDQWPDPIPVEVPGTVLPPPVGQGDIDRIAADIERLQTATVTVSAETLLPPTEGEEGEEGDGEAQRGDTSIVLTPTELRALVAVEADPDAAEGQRLRLVPDLEGPPPRLVALMDLARVAPDVQAHIENRSPTPNQGEDPADISEVTGDLVVDAVLPGFEPDREATIAAVIEAGLAGGGDVRVSGAPQEDATPEDAGITQPVSTFTTYFQAGQSRVQNIHRIAEIVDGVVIPAGESFELNHFVGRRTVENGFTVGGAIIDGELTSDIGGGVSQFATTFFNAAWFSGMELVEFKAHSFYFDRYPPGREATIFYPDVNLEIRNTTPYDILVDTDFDETSITVTFWSTPYWDVQTIMGPCGCGGSFRITNQRILTAPGGSPMTEEYTTIYSVPR